MRSDKHLNWIIGTLLFLCLPWLLTFVSAGCSGPPKEVTLTMAVAGVERGKAAEPGSSPAEADEMKGAETFVRAFMQARMSRHDPSVWPYLSEKAFRQYREPGLTLTGMSNPHFSRFEVLNAESLGGSFVFLVRIYEGLYDQGEIGYFEETLTVIRTNGEYLVDDVKRGSFVNYKAAQ